VYYRIHSIVLHLFAMQQFISLAYLWTTRFSKVINLRPSACSDNLQGAVFAWSAGSMYLNGCATHLHIKTMHAEQSTFTRNLGVNTLKIPVSGNNTH